MPFHLSELVDGASAALLRMVDDQQALSYCFRRGMFLTPGTSIGGMEPDAHMPLA